MPESRQAPRTEPAHNLLYNPTGLAPVRKVVDTEAILQAVIPSLKNPFNERQQEAFRASFTQRLSLLWGPPGTGKTTVLGGIILGWLELAFHSDHHICIGVGASNYNAIDNVLIEVADLLERRRQQTDVDLPVKVMRVSSDSATPPRDSRIRNIQRSSEEGENLGRELQSPGISLVVGGTWMQLGKLCEAVSSAREPVSQWFDLLIIDEASQLEVSAAAPYFLLLKEDAHVVLAGDHRQLGPIYGFQMRELQKGLFDCIFTYMQETNGIQPTMFNRSFRGNDEIVTYPSERFYEQDYTAYNPQRRLNISLPGNTRGMPQGWPEQLLWSNRYWQILDPELPVVVITYDATGWTLSNPFEAQIVAAFSCLYRRILDDQNIGVSDEEFWEQRLGIVTPHRAQMATIRNTLVEAGGLPMNPPPFVDTVDRFQGLERDLMIASYTVADRDFVKAEEEFILNPRRFNVTLTRARSKFVMLVSDAIIQHLPSDIQVARDAAHIQLFVMNYCNKAKERISLPFWDNGSLSTMACWFRGR